MNKLKITITIDEETFEEMKKICKQSGQKISSVINILINKFVIDSKKEEIKND